MGGFTCPMGDTIGFTKEDAVAIEKTSPELERIVSPDQELELLGSALPPPRGPYGTVKEDTSFSAKFSRIGG